METKNLVRYKEFWTYKNLIDPLTKRLRKEIHKQIEAGSSILDVACGPGTLLYELSPKIIKGTGIDLDSGKIDLARKFADKRGITNLQFVEGDAGKIADIFQDKFDYVILSLAIHQFPQALRDNIIEGAIKVGQSLIIADYSVPVPSNIPGLLAKTIEKMAGKEHYRAYSSFIKQDGINGIVKRYGLKCNSLSIAGNGVFSIIKCNPKQDQYS